MKLLAIHADITTLEVDVIVNAANQYLSGGGGVDGAIHRAAGPELMAECRLLGGCAVGDAKLTKAYKLPAMYIVHAVGPRWSGSNKNEPELLASCYERSIRLAESVEASSIAFPSISTGIFRFPIEMAATIAVEAIRSCVTECSSLKQITFCCFDQSDFDVYKSVIHSHTLLN